MTDVVTVYAKCQDCDLEFLDRAAVSEHTKETVVPVNEGSVVARGHRVSIINPTDEERRASKIRSLVSDGLDSLYERLADGVERGDFTAAEVGDNFWAFDLDDGWESYMEDENG